MLWLFFFLVLSLHCLSLLVSDFTYDMASTQLKDTLRLVLRQFRCFHRLVLAIYDKVFDVMSCVVIPGSFKLLPVRGNVVKI